MSNTSANLIAVKEATVKGVIQFSPTYTRFTPCLCVNELRLYVAFCLKSINLIR